MAESRAADSVKSQHKPIVSERQSNVCGPDDADSDQKILSSEGNQENDGL
jgi:hypothetical protein